MKNDKPILSRPSIRHPSNDRHSLTPVRATTNGDSDSSFDINISQTHDDSKKNQEESKSYPKYHEESYHSIVTRSHDDFNKYQEESQSHTEYEAESYHCNVVKDQQKKGFGFGYTFILISIILTFVWPYCWPLVKKLYAPRKVIEEIKTCSFSDFEQNFPQNENAWLSLSSGVENIMNGKADAPAVYLFLHYKDMPSKMISNIAHKASSCLEGGSVVKMDSTDFTSKEAIKDYGYVVKKYKQKIKEGNVVMIVNLNEIPAEAAGALHPICDTANPIIKKVVILMTLTSQESSEKDVVVAENTLYELWGSKIDDSSLQPLVTRIIDQVIVIK